MFAHTDPFWKIYNLIENDGKPNEDTDIIEEYVQQQADDLNNGENCPICKSKSTVKFNGGCDVCTNCGSDIREHIDRNQEWRYYGAADSKRVDPTRTGMVSNPMLNSNNIGTKMLNNNKSSFSLNKLCKNARNDSINTKDRTLFNTFTLIANIAKKASLNKKITDMAQEFYKEISKVKISRGQNRIALQASCLFEACRIYSVPRTIEEMAKAAGVTKKKMTHGHKMFKSIATQLGNISNFSKINVYVKPAKSSDYIERFCSNLNMSLEMTERCKYVVEQVKKYRLLRKKTPKSIAAGTLYLISMIYNLGISKQDIREATSGTSEATIVTCLRQLDTHRSLLINDEEIQKRLKARRDDTENSDLF